MGAAFRLARTAQEVDAVRRLRHRVFVEQGGYLSPTPDGRIGDEFDLLPDAGTVIGLVGGELAGSYRATPPVSGRLATDAVFDCRPHLPADARPAAVNYLCVDERFRGTPGLVRGLIAGTVAWGLQRGFTHTVGVLNPERNPLLVRFGYTLVGSVFLDAARGIACQPAYQDLRTLPDHLRETVQMLSTSLGRST